MIVVGTLTSIIVQSIASSFVAYNLALATQVWASVKSQSVNHLPMMRVPGIGMTRSSFRQR